MLITFSIVYLIVISAKNDLAAYIDLSSVDYFNRVYRRPFGPIGYYSLGIMASIFYYEYQIAKHERS